MLRRRTYPQAAPAVDVRPLLASELPQIARVFEDSATELASGLIEQRAGRSTQLVGWRDGKAVGMASVEWTGPREPAVRAVFPACAEIHSVHVQESPGSDGIGPRLMTACESMAIRRGYGRTGIAVALDNEGTLAQYLRSGYAEEQRVEFESPVAALRAAGRVAGMRWRFFVKSL